MLEVKLISLLFGFACITQATATFCTKQGENGVTERICCAGYVGDGTNCVYHCTNGCVNGECTGPEECECNEGFAKRDGMWSRCEAIPPDPQQQLCHDRCFNGTCSAGLCTCSQGWLLQQTESGEICVPQCENSLNNSSGGCVNGYCSAPGNCVCFEGFVRLASNERECIPAMDGTTWGKLLALGRQYHWHIAIAAIILIIVLLAFCYPIYCKCRKYVDHRIEARKGKAELNRETDGKTLTSCYVHRYT
ncbi:multiple epidermal growth factor-like domains protein 10 [Zeugodacus cucurbitae]|uniref:multiple epidermal growth factor-like domains protein 10 n=1 Tax=Zeugodacus cucurbitae TaxID=28588 RepID=UPI0023D91AB5|nr:multiple epidermal growth factor-like domains protein 10 [Zeugodacus cucurbitae]